MANTKLKNGFSLVEMLVAIAVFMSVMVVAVSALITIINSNKEAESIKATTDNVTFAIEGISRDMRIGTNYRCMLSNGSFTNVCNLSDGSIPGSSAVRYTNNSGDDVTYQFNTIGSNAGALTELDCPAGYSDISQCTQADLISTDSNVKISNMVFYVIGANNESNPVQSQRTQPRVIITISGFISAKGTATSTFDLQTNISQRVRISQ